MTLHPIVQSKRAEIAALCRELGGRRLDVFGSAVTDHFDPDRSDVDVLVDVDPDRLTMRRDPRTYLWDAVRAITHVEQFTRNRTFQDYEADVLPRSGVER